MFVALTVGDQQEDKGFVLHQVEDGAFVGVIFRRGVREDGLSVTGRDGRTVPNDCRKRRIQTSGQTSPKPKDVPVAARKKSAVDTAAVA